MARRRPKKQLTSLLVLALLLYSLPFVLKALKKVQQYLSRASGQTASIVVDASINQGPLNPIWQALSQGGEEKDPFNSVLPEIADLKPKYIRIDHLYDFYNVVTKENGKLVFNWRELDTLVDQIQKTGAVPFFSLSYMPQVIALGGEITNAPTNWDDWTLVVKETIQHYSGRDDKNIKNCAYEVWNEPDLFGNWKINGIKDYRLLYKYAVLGANQTTNTNPYKIGGPSVTAPYKNWVDGFLTFVFNEGLRLDFYSWHRYDPDPKKFLEDIDAVDTWLFQNAGYTLEKDLTEFGSVSDKSPLHDSQFDAAHLVAVIRQLIQRTDFAFTFEIIDGPTQGKQKYVGGWGLLTNEAAGAVEKKPKYQALIMLNSVSGDRIELSGEGTWVTGFATKNKENIQVILSNLDPNNQHSETVPVFFKNLENGTYSYQESFLGGQQKNEEITVNDHSLTLQTILSPNNVVLIELKKV